MNRLATHLAERYDGKRILILGWAREGQTTHTLLTKACPTAELFVSDGNQDVLHEWMQETNIELRTSPYLQDLQQFDVIFKTPGVPIHIPELQEYLASGGVVTSQLAEFLSVYRDQVIGITGTKGKSTTASLIAHLYAAAGKEVLLAGNIGKPVFEVASELTSTTTIVIEMSSYQLETIQTSPHLAVLLNLFPEHLNYHRTLENYLLAKAKITHFQNSNDTVIFNQDSPELSLAVQNSSAQKIPFSYQAQLQYPEVVQQVMSMLDQLDLPSTIKKWNILPALLVTSLELDLSADQMVDALKEFRTLPHRLETVGQFGAVTWIDDTLATIPEATIAALDSLPKVDVLMVGGFDRGISYQKIIDAIQTKKIAAIAFFKPSGQLIFDGIRAQYPESSWPKMQLVESMEEAVRFAYQHAPENGVVLLSPSSPSFGQFKDYEDKSAQYRSWIEQLANQDF